MNTSSNIKNFDSLINNDVSFEDFIKKCKTVAKYSNVMLISNYKSNDINSPFYGKLQIIYRKNEHIARLFFTKENDDTVILYNLKKDIKVNIGHISKIFKNFKYIICPNGNVVFI